ncbi:MAG: hypothetical protein ACOCWW_00735, partial [Bacteroidota bacterium]
GTISPMARLHVHGGNLTLTKGRMGIGVQRPQAALDVVGEVKVKYGSIEMRNENSRSILNTDLQVVPEHESPVSYFNIDHCGISPYGGGLRFLTGVCPTPEERMRITPNGKVGIGTDDPQAVLHVTVPDHSVYNRIRFEGLREVESHAIRFELHAPNSLAGEDNRHFAIINKNRSSGNILKIRAQNDDNTCKEDILNIEHNGNVGIGTSSPEAKFHINHENSEDWSKTFRISVNADKTKAFTINNTNINENIFMIWGNGVVNAKTIRAEAVKIRPEPIGQYWADHVFDKNYELMTLSELEKFIDDNKHLPKMYSAEKVKEEGIDLYDMNVKLLEKIEELTLYTIEQDKQIKEMREEIEKLKCSK